MDTITKISEAQLEHERLKSRNDMIVAVSARLAGLAAFALGLLGIHYGIEYSGWAIFCGVLLLLP